MNKADLRVLERAFEREIFGGILQGKSKRIEKLVKDGYLEPITETSRDRLGTFTCEGYVLTHLGRLQYCSTCNDTEDTP